jgi:integrase/recombinase XerD
MIEYACYSAGNVEFWAKKLDRTEMSWKYHLRGFQDYLILERNLSKNTVSAYLSDLNKIARHSPEISPDQWQPELVAEAVRQEAKTGIHVRSQARMISAVKAFFKYLLLEGVIDENPTRLLDAPRLTRPLPDVLSETEINNMLSIIDRSTIEGERNFCMLELLYASGLRVSELVQLSLEDLYLEDGFIRVRGKGNKERLVPIHPGAVQVLTHYMRHVRPLFKLEKNKQLFISHRGRGLSRVMVFLVIKKTAQLAGIQKNISPHTFRHAFASHLVSNGADLRVVQELLGHESITTTEIYTHLDRKQVFEALLKYHPLSGQKL